MKEAGTKNEMSSNANEVVETKVKDANLTCTTWQVPDFDHNQLGQPDSKVASKANTNVVQPPTANELEEIRKSAYSEGRKEGQDKGYIEGQKKGLRQGEKEMKVVVQRMEQLLQKLQELIQQQDEQLEQAVLQMVVVISQVVIKRELEIDSSQILQVVKEAITLIKGACEKLKIHLNPKDINILQNHITDFSDYSDQWKLVSDKTVTAGGCYIEDSSTLVNATIEDRFEKLLQQVCEKQMPEDNTPNDTT